MDFKFYISLFLRRLPYFLICMALGTAIGFSLASVLPPTYLAQARLLMEAGQIPGAQTVNTDPVEQMQILQQRIMNRANLLELANRLEVYKGQPELPADQIVTDMRARLLITKQVQQGANTNRGGPAPSVLVSVSFTAPTSAMSANVANEIVTLILQENVEMRKVVAGQTLDFFVQEVDRLDKELTRLTEAIIKFKGENQSALPDSLQFRQNQQALEQGRLLTMERDEAALKDRKDQLVALYEATGQVGSSGGPTSPEQKQLQGLKDQLTSALALLAPSNPRIKIIQSQVDSLEKIVAAQAGAAAISNGQVLDPYQVQLADIDAQLAYLAEQKAQVTKRLDDLAKSIAATPGVTLALDTLNRDFSNVRAQYDNAVQAKARAETGELIETLSKGQRISVLEQAVPPLRPDSPNRTLIAGAGVGVGMALGLLFIVVLELLNRAIRRPVELTTRLGITAFATLPYMRTRSESRWRMVIIVTALVAVTIGIPLSLWAIDQFVVPLDQLVDRLVSALGIKGLIQPLRQSLGL